MLRDRIGGGEVGSLRVVEEEVPPSMDGNIHLRLPAIPPSLVDNPREITNNPLSPTISLVP